jgi:hypothetical protein
MTEAVGLFTMVALWCMEFLIVGFPETDPNDHSSWGPFWRASWREAVNFFHGKVGLEPINNALRQRAAEHLANGITHDDGRGGITNLLGFIDDISSVVPLEDLLFLCQQFKDRGISLGCFMNPDKTRILTSTNGTSPIPTISCTNPSLANDITDAIATFSTKPNKLNPSHPTPVEITDGFRLLVGIPVGSPSFVIDFINKQLLII